MSTAYRPRNRQDSFVGGSAVQSPSKKNFDIPQAKLGKAYRYSKSRVSDPSTSIVDVNVPEVSGITAEFVYNFYTFDERVNAATATNLSSDKTPRYVALSWNSPSLSDFNSRQESIERSTGLSIQANSDKIISEDNFFNPSYVSHTFSDSDVIEQGASDLESYARLSRTSSESVFKMSKYQVQEVATESSDPQQKQQLVTLTEAYSSLSDFPKDALGLRVYDEKGRLNDEDDLLRSITNGSSINVRINCSVVPDIFKGSIQKETPDHLKALNQSYAKFLKNGSKEASEVDLVTVDSNNTSAANLDQPVKLVGYAIDRYAVSPDGLKKDSEFYVEDIQTTQFEDRSVLYGLTYVYSVRVVAAVKTLSYSSDRSKVSVSTIYVSSLPTSAPIECYEYTPPPEPDTIRFKFDYNKRNLIVLWDTPVNSQRDIKQFQVFRRKTIREPFELIAQYGFDTSVPGIGSTGRYTTGERVDANNLDNMSPDDKYLVKVQPAKNGVSSPVYMHVDEDFTVDTEFFVSSEYIYAVCSVDAHGMISNYSTQHHVTFDPYKNRLVSRVVCDSGSPKQYPNMKLRLDAFKDTISVSGDDARKLDVYFTPEYLRVRDDRGATYKIVEAVTVKENPRYILQLINLDNQKTQTLQISIKDPQNLTL